MNNGEINREYYVYNYNSKNNGERTQSENTSTVLEIQRYVHYLTIHDSS